MQKTGFYVDFINMTDSELVKNLFIPGNVGKTVHPAGRAEKSVRIWLAPSQRWLHT